MNRSKPSASLNQQIRQLQQQMADDLVLQQQQRLKVRELLIERLTSWPVLLGAVATGLLLNQIRRQGNAVDPASQAPTRATTASTSSGLTPEQIAAHQCTEPASFWSKLLSLPLLTQGIWWLAEQVWYSTLFRDVARQKLLKSDQRHPPY
ncbi:hypothetical protein EOE67_05115 [Rheinheimera riviphila]|uniref:Uncharacterized protein n=1 Tax=Rheinheimera riviphila TaxID=1834037 RepID=A0A437R132_9GAMM|nr:hypothetical protein [Rheinheimera riviphila]RVU40433.1 hypothetical protein EOE67_05115 [Rheinheimera riviphila]